MKAEDDLSNDIISSFEENSFDAKMNLNSKQNHTQNDVSRHQDIIIENIESSDSGSSESCAGSSDLPD